MISVIITILLTASPGDLIFIKSQTVQSQALRDATGSEWTHVGIYLDGKVYESTGVTTVNKFIARSKDNAYYIKSIDGFYDAEQFRKVLKKYTGTPYDIYFEWSDDKIYCSEYVYKVYKESFNIETGMLQTFRDMNLEAPSVKALIKARYKNGKTFNLDETIVTPVSVLEYGTTRD